MMKLKDNAITPKTHGSPRRHREITIELRKSKKDEKKCLFKSRKISDDEKKEGPNGGSPVQMTVEEMVAAMNASDDPERQFQGMQQARMILSRDRYPPIDMMIGHGIVPLCVGFLQHYDNVMLQFEAAWALTNIVSGTSQQTHCVIEQNAVPHFVALLGSKSSRLAEQAVWALGNIAGDGAYTRDIVIHHNCIPGILKLVKKEDTSLSFLRNIVWLMSNLCRNKNPSPPLEHVKQLLPVLSDLLLEDDHKLLTDTCWALAYVTDDDNNMIQEVIDTDAVPRLVRLLDTDESNIIVPALRAVGNIVTGTDEQTDVVIAAGGLPKLVTLLQHSKVLIVKEAAWTVSNITAGNQEQIQAVVDAGIFEHIRHVLHKGDFRAQKEAAWALFNTITSCTPEQVFDLLERYKLLQPFLDLLAAPDPRTIKVVQTGLRNLFVLAEKSGRIKNFKLMVDDLGGLRKLMLLQRHENEEVYKKARSIIETYYMAAPEEVQVAQAPQQEHNNNNNNNDEFKD